MAPPHVTPKSDKVSPESQTSIPTRRVAQLSGHLASTKETEKINTRPALPIDYPVSRHQIDPNQFIDDVRELKVAVIGAGLAGINAGILLPAKVPGINLTIFEKNNDVVCFRLPMARNAVLYGALSPITTSLITDLFRAAHG